MSGGASSTGSAVLPPALIAQLVALTPDQQQAAAALLNTLMNTKGPVILPAVAAEVCAEDDDDDDDCVIATVETSPVREAAAESRPYPRSRKIERMESPSATLQALGPPYKRPRGQAPKGADGNRKEWDENMGVWIDGPAPTSASAVSATPL